MLLYPGCTELTRCPWWNFRSLFLLTRKCDPMNMILKVQPFLKDRITFFRKRKCDYTSKTLLKGHLACQYQSTLYYKAHGKITAWPTCSMNTQKVTNMQCEHTKSDQHAGWNTQKVSFQEWWSLWRTLIAKCLNTKLRCCILWRQSIGRILPNTYDFVTVREHLLQKGTELLLTLITCLPQLIRLVSCSCPAVSYIA